MKQFILGILTCSILVSCSKTSDPTNLNYLKTYTVTGTLISSNTHLPLKGRGISLSQSNNMDTTDPGTVTDSNGYFKISYHPNGTNQLNLHPTLANYQCVFTDINILENIPKGKDIDLGTIYTNAFIK